MLERKVKRALIITDGYVERGLPPPPCLTEALLPHEGFAPNLLSAKIPVTHLPQFNV